MAASEGLITLTVKPPPLMLPLIAVIKKRTDGSLAAIKSALETGAAVETINYLSAPEELPGFLAFCEELLALDAELTFWLDGELVDFALISNLHEAFQQTVARLNDEDDGR